MAGWDGAAGGYGYGKAGGMDWACGGMGKGGSWGPYSWSGAAWSGGSTGGCEGELHKEQLVSQVKEIQRTSQEGKEQWWTYCDNMNVGGRDPQRMPADMIQGFLEAYSNGDITSLVASAKSGTTVLRLRGLPFNCVVADIVQFLYGYDVTESSVRLVPGVGGRSSGEALVRFRSPNDADRALEHKHKKEMGRRYIEVFRSSEQDWADALSGPAGGGSSNAGAAAWSGGGAGSWSGSGAGNWGCMGGGADWGGKGGMGYWGGYQMPMAAGYNGWGGMGSMGSMGGMGGMGGKGGKFGKGGKGGHSFATPPAGTPVIRLRGLPFSHSTAGDVIKFLGSDYITVNEVAVGLRPGDGKPTGEAFVAIASQGLAQNLIDTKHKSEMGSRYVEVMKSTVDEWATAMESQQTYGCGGGGGSWSCGGGGNWGGAWGWGGSAGTWGGGGGEPQDEKSQLVTQIKTIQRSGEEAKSKWWRYCDAHCQTSYDPNRHDAAFLRTFLDAFSSGQDPVSAIYGEMQPEDSQKGFVLRMRGMPYHCGQQEVLEFFTGFSIDPNSVVLGRGQDGRPSGEAFVLFSSHEECQRAFQDKQKSTMGTRYIELFESDMRAWRYASQLAAGTATSPAAANQQAQGNAIMPYFGTPADSDPEKESLVDRVKQIQRSGEEYKQVWWNFCTSRGTGDYDPRRHNAQFLQAFLEHYKNSVVG